MLAGVAAGWWRDGLAALLMLGGWALFHVAEGHVPPWSLFHVAAVDGGFFALSWAGRWLATSHDDNWKRRLAITAAIIGLPVLFALLLNLASNRPAPGPVVAGSSPVTFGPVIERVINDWALHWDGFIDFDSGQLLDSREVFSTDDLKELLSSKKRAAAGLESNVDDFGKVLDWTKRTGADAMFLSPQSADTMGLRALDMAVIETNALAWDGCTPGAIITALRGQSHLGEWKLMPMLSPRVGLPGTYLFKTREGGAGLLQIIGFTENPRGVKIRYKLVQRGEGAGKQSVQIEPIEKASSAQPLAGRGAMTFGPEGKGLRAAVELISSNGVFALGEPIEVLFHIRNTSSTNIYVAGGSWRQDEAFYITIEDQQGRQIPAQHIYHSVRTPIQRNLLLPGESAVFHSSGLAFLGKDADGKQFTQPVGNYVKVTPGRYTVRYRLHFPDLLTTGFPQSSDWEGDLDTAPVTVEVTTANKFAAAPGFGPVIERVLPSSAPCRMQYFQFHTGKVFTIGDGPSDKTDHAEDYRRAEETGGLDVSVIGGKDGLQLAGRGCVFTRDKSPNWDTMAAEAAVRTLRRESWLNGVVEVKQKDFPATYLFKTARGECGLLQILGVSDEPLGMKFRYKLVEGVAASPATPASAHIPSFGPVIERVLDFDTSRQAAYLDLDTGEYVDPGTNATNSLLSMKATPAGVDLRSSSVESNFDVRWGINLAVVPVEPMRWEATAEEIRLALGSVERHPEIRLGGGRSTNTWFFQTSEGGRGVLQFLPPKAGDDPSQVRLRYRLVQPASPSGSSTVKPKATTEQVIVEDLAGEAVRRFQSRNQTNKPMKTTFTVLLTVAVALLAHGRPFRAWSFQELTDQADLVVIAKPISTTNTTEHSVLPNTGSPGVRVVGVNTEFEVLVALKGDKSLKTLVLHHCRLANPEEHLVNGPSLVSFDPKQPNRFLLFLHKDPDGRYSPVSGQTDASSVSVYKLEGPHGEPPSHAGSPLCCRRPEAKRHVAFQNEQRP
jgi:hypothetical protein